MARLPRFVIPGHPQHIIVRGNNREPIFYADEDYQFYLEKLEQACDKHQCDVHAYILMTNHTERGGRALPFACSAIMDALPKAVAPPPMVSRIKRINAYRVTSL